MNARVSVIEDLLAALDPDMRYLFEERAGIIEFDGELPRDAAERLALIDLLRSHPGALLGISLVRINVNCQTEYAIATDVYSAQQRLSGLGAEVTQVDNPAAVLDKDFSGLALLRKVV